MKELERAVRRLQAESRIPALSVALHRADRPLWTFTVGGAGPDTRFAIGSVTKTFTSVLVLQCRDDGLLRLDDPIGRHWQTLAGADSDKLHRPDVPAHEGMTIRRLLSHTAGLQREPYGDVWDTLDPPDVAGLLDDLRHAEQVLPAGRRFHYSNLGFALLGHLAGKLRGSTWEQAVSDRILSPLGLAGTATGHPAERAAGGYLVDAYTDHAREEPVFDLRGVAPAGSIWSTAADLARWAAFLADPAAVDPEGAVLSAYTMEEMAWPRTVTDWTQWSVGVGLGLRLSQQGDRILHIGHGGAMPGFLAQVVGRRGGKDTPGAMGCAVLASSGTADGVEELGHELLRTAVTIDPADIAPWTPGRPAPEEYRTVLGRWWGEGIEYVFSWRDGGLQARAADAAADMPPAVFAPLPGDRDRLRVVSGREVGELLRLTRDTDGTVVRMHWATYRFTRTQETFRG